MGGIRDKLDYLLASFEFHLGEGLAPSEAWGSAIEDYAYVYCTDDGGSPLSRAARRVLEHLSSDQGYSIGIRGGSVRVLYMGNDYGALGFNSDSAMQVVAFRVAACCVEEGHQVFLRYNSGRNTEFHSLRGEKEEQ